MNFTNKGKFKPGNKVANNKAGKKHKATLIKEIIGIENLEDLEKDLLKGWYDMLHSKCKTDKRFALKEISRYVFSVKKEVKDTIIFDPEEAKKSIEEIFMK